DMLQVAERIGKGAYGSVWQATILNNKQDVVVKVSKDKRPSENMLESFRREIEIMSSLPAHPNVVSLIGVTSDKRVLILEEAMVDLHVMIKRQSCGLPLSVVQRWTKGILQGLDFLHNEKVVHRDLKPSNILVFFDMSIKIGDFGLSRYLTEPKLPVRREISTLWYRAPELIMGTSMYCSKIDLWSIGCVVLEMLLGRCAFPGKIEDVCKCPKSSHFNYNGDQLLRIFQLIGTP
ncbi:hypothetical protein GUITHDRAFT_44546, partial [Guillardia theta CCMP2712]